MPFNKTIISFRIRDSDGETAAIPIYGIVADDGATIGAVISSAQGIATLLDPLLSGQIVEMNISLVPSLPGGLKTTAVAGSEIEVIGGLPITTTFKSRYDSLDLVAFSPALFVAGSNRMLMTNSDLISFIDRLKANSTIQCTDRGWHGLITGNMPGEKRFHKHRVSTKRH